MGGGALCFVLLCFVYLCVFQCLYDKQNVTVIGFSSFQGL